MSSQNVIKWFCSCFAPAFQILISAIYNMSEAIIHREIAMPSSRISFIKTVRHAITLALFIMMLLWVQSVRAQHWSVQNYEDIIGQIAEHHDELATTANTSGFKLRTPYITNGMVEMSYMFGYDDPQFGINGHMPLLNKFEVVGKDPSWIKYNFHTINQAMVGTSGTVQTGNPFVSDALNASNTPWLTKQTEWF